MILRRHIVLHRGATRKGTTLLEVLIASGILVVGLASVAALLPAAGVILSDAVAADRAAAIVANAAADLDFRRTLTAAQFTAAIKTVMIGDVFLAAPFNAAPFNAAPYSRIASIPTATVDDRAYGRTWFVATASPLAESAVAMTVGMPVRVSVAVIRSRTPEVKTPSLVLTEVSSGVYRMTGGTAIARELDRKRFLTPCAWVPVLKNSRVRWLQIQSSWSTYAAGTGGSLGAITQCYVSFVDSNAADDVKSGVTITAYPISGVIRVEERILILN